MHSKLIQLVIVLGSMCNTCKCSGACMYIVVRSIDVLYKDETTHSITSYEQAMALINDTLYQLCCFCHLHCNLLLDRISANLISDNSIKASQSALTKQMRVQLGWFRGCITTVNLVTLQWYDPWSCIWIINYLMNVDWYLVEKKRMQINDDDILKGVTSTILNQGCASYLINGIPTCSTIW